MSSTRIISLVPSLTELLFDLGLGSNLVGRTRFCIHPEEEIVHVPIIGGTKNPDIDKIRVLSPDFVIANKEENRKEDIEQIESFTKVMVTDISTINKALYWIQKIGSTLEVRDRTITLIDRVNNELLNTPAYRPIPTAYFIWREPWMTIGKDTYIHDVMEQFGFRNVYKNTERYPEIAIGDLKSRNPELVLLSSEPFPFREKHIGELHTHLPETDIQLIDGEWFSWYGSRMLPSFKNLKSFRNQLG